MTKEKLLAKIADYEKQNAQLVANANFINGKMQECKEWLAELENTGAVDETASKVSA